jgi:uncharacterized alkaline shock family protein YloU
MNESNTGYQEAPVSGEPLRSDRDRTIVSDVVIAKIAGIAAQDVEGVRMGGSDAASNGGSFVDGVGWDGQPRDVSVRVVEKEAEIDLTMTVEYGRAIPQIIEKVRRNVISRVENQAGYGVAKANITVKDVLVPEAGSRLGRQPEGEQTAKVEDEEQDSAPSSRARSSSSSSSSSSSTYFHLGPGGPTSTSGPSRWSSISRRGKPSYPPTRTDHGNPNRRRRKFELFDLGGGVSLFTELPRKRSSRKLRHNPSHPCALGPGRSRFSAPSRSDSMSATG